MDKYLDQFVKAPPAIKFGGLAFVVGALTAANFFMVIQPTEEEIGWAVAERRKLDLELADKSEIAQNLNERRREMDVLEQKLSEALTELPEQRDIEELLAQINDIGKKSGLELSSVTPGKESVGGGEFFARIPIKMTVSGNYHEIALFLQEMANMRRIVNVNNIKFDSAKLKNEKVVLQSEFQATTFRFVEQKAAASTAGNSNSKK
ncbi:type IV pilus biogenesis protein PilO [Myxococcus xanthus DK 1622]|uniref:PilO n=1 Tax=Myxococcus xanthus (strain DK1622) TaxID=246197 RepID=Q306N4_MYXXD|nr:MULTISPECIES: type 4a pilus biogenesis protein PilO [Myxococcus]3JC8_Oa Chain Oa, PilO [Myxococcus xanthus DK 1622]3JC8_Ob Chain Ob, PilO [Myxococcus xanthus DK 1622]3JC8_Oc Chain Oc, PilO [Myxococcus xanthus DK 1622]3JC8_Od Chain Od, PilO [Myxococcus xanthus DK 1622]3JC8_Oe Chain Oe, PilO [Myxococcus xanthus DK 1622]3JC8_Of Chain Of, PilO [Myxococcus xanthus DK 1622]3JC8_Og Chain Og, PilO [Myxococcus xanthus DK 1622]3JC8_Oh Chain Oh, PilO [Myxococcus xanthus DK 1622]3JC8_Oi Chain Oi, P